MDVSPSGPGNESFHFNLYLTMVFQYLESTLHVSYCYVRQTSASGKLSGCQEQPLLKWYA